MERDRRARFRPGVVAACLAVLGLGAPQREEEPALQMAVFAAGCFWCAEAAFDAVPGVVATVSGYAGGHVPDPSYRQVTTGLTGHAEVVQVVFDPALVSYRRLLEVFWRNVDPVDGGGQFCDRGPQYRSAIFVLDREQQRLAEESKRRLEESGRLDAPVATRIEPVAQFYRAEDEHQDFHARRPVHYRRYVWQCGRMRRLEALWGKEPLRLFPEPEGAER